MEPGKRYPLPAADAKANNIGNNYFKMVKKSG